MGAAGEPGQRPDGSAHRTEENCSISTNCAVGLGVDNKKKSVWVQIENGANRPFGARWTVRLGISTQSGCCGECSLAGRCRNFFGRNLVMRESVWAVEGTLGRRQLF